MRGAKHSALVALIWTAWLGVILEGAWSGGGSSSVTRWENIFWGLCKEIEFSFVWGWGKHLSPVYILHGKKDGESHEEQRRQTGTCSCWWHREGAWLGNLPVDTQRLYFPPRGAYKGRVSSILLIINNSRTVKCLLKYPVSFSASPCAEQGEICKHVWEG